MRNAVLRPALWFFCVLGWLKFPLWAYLLTVMSQHDLTAHEPVPLCLDHLQCHLVVLQIILISGANGRQPPPQWVWELMKWCFLTTYQPWGTRAAPPSGVQAVNEAAASRRSTFFVGAVLACPNSRFSNQKSHSSLLSSSSSIYGEPSLRKFSRFTIVFTSSAVAMAAHAPRYSLDLTSSPPLIVPIWNKNGPTSFHGLARLSVSFW